MLPVRMKNKLFINYGQNELLVNLAYIGEVKEKSYLRRRYFLISGSM